MQDELLGVIHLTNRQIINIIFWQSGYGEVWYRAWFGSKRPRVRIPILRPNKKVHPPGGLSYLDGLRDSKGRHQSAGWCKKVSGGHFFSPWENPLVSGRTPWGCGQKPILPLPQAQLLHFNKPCRNTQHLLWMSGVFYLSMKLSQKFRISIHLGC